jgi:hypothetical protein
LSAKSSFTLGVSCSAHTHRCAAVTVTTRCSGFRDCRITRSIQRYRYVGARPPVGTARLNPMLTAPVVGAASGIVRRPKKLVLVLSGAPHRRVEVLLSGPFCVSNTSAAISGAPNRELAVPSRSRIPFPHASSFLACQVGALVLSRQPGTVHVTIANR